MLSQGHGTRAIPYRAPARICYGRFPCGRRCRDSARAVAEATGGTRGWARLDRTSDAVARAPGTAGRWATPFGLHWRVCVNRRDSKAHGTSRSRSAFRSKVQSPELIQSPELRCESGSVGENRHGNLGTYGRDGDGNNPLLRSRHTSPTHLGVGIVHQPYLMPYSCIAREFMLHLWRPATFGFGFSPD